MLNKSFDNYRVSPLYIIWIITYNCRIKCGCRNAIVTI